MHPFSINGVPKEHSCTVGKKCKPLPCKFAQPRFSDFQNITPARCTPEMKKRTAGQGVRFSPAGISRGLGALP